MELLRFVTRLLILERRLLGTPSGSRSLTCREQAVLALRWFRDRTRPDRLAVDNGISRATAYRYVAEAVDVLSAQAPGLDEALERALADGVPYLILDGKIFETDRLGETVTSVKGEEIDAWYSGKKHRPGANVQAVMLPSGLPIWTSPAEPGHVHDITAARAHALPLLYRAAADGMPTLADGGYDGAGIGIHVPVKNPGGNQQLDPDNRTRNSLLRGLRSQGERGFALLSQRWTTLQRITASPRRVTEIVQAALVLTLFQGRHHRFPQSRRLRRRGFSSEVNDCTDGPRGLASVSVRVMILTGRHSLIWADAYCAHLVRYPAGRDKRRPIALTRNELAY